LRCLSLFQNRSRRNSNSPIGMATLDAFFVGLYGCNDSITLRAAGSTPLRPASDCSNDFGAVLFARTGKAAFSMLAAGRAQARLSRQDRTLLMKSPVRNPRRRGTSLVGSDQKR